jgi:serine/threonine protein kinase
MVQRPNIFPSSNLQIVSQHIAIFWSTSVNKFVSVAFGIQWRAPQEYSYKPETEKIDVWSLGNVLYYILTRREPFDKYNDDEIPVHVMEGNVPDIKDATILNSTHPFDMTLLKVVKMCWEYDPEKRPSSRQVASILQEALNKLN